MRNTLNYESKDILLRPKRAHISSQKVACVTTIAHNTLAYNQLHKSHYFSIKTQQNSQAANTEAA